jgi:two-component system sensor histidine kinase/response regulator
MPKIILIVEDYAVNRSFVKFILEDYGYEVTEAENGQKAVESVINKTPDLILMDLAMPDMDGLMATRAIRQLDGMANLPIIAVSAYGDLYHKQAMEAGFNGFINKPFDPTILKPLLQKYLTA